MRDGVSGPLGSSCQDEVIIDKLTCRLEKSVNATTQIVRELQEEIGSLHQVQMQHHLTIIS